MISWRSKLLCPSEIRVYTCDVQSSSIWHCTAEAEVFGLGTPPTPQPLPSPSPHIYALLSCMTCMWSQRTRRLAICFIRVRCGFDQVILSRAVTAWIQRWQLNVSFKYLGESWNKVKDLSTLGLIWQGWAKWDLFHWALSSWRFDFQVGWIIQVCDQYVGQKSFRVLVFCLLWLKLCAAHSRTQPSFVLVIGSLGFI